KRLDFDKEYQIDVRVKRLEGYKISEVSTIKANTTTFAPGPPIDLHCMWTLSDGLELRWRAPLRSGCVLTTAHVRITRITHWYDHVLYKRDLSINSNNYTYVHAVNVTLEEGHAI
ncbi:Protein-tyrosine-phosphatase, partial [Gryllus bimaculatus]